MRASSISSSSKGREVQVVNDTPATSSPWHAQVLTLFPEMFPGPLSTSVVGAALDVGQWRLSTVDIRAYGIGRHRAVDDTPAGGGPGMVMRCDVVAAALDHAAGLASELPVLCLSPRGEPLSQSLIRELAAGPGVALLAGRFEGIDERVIAARGLREISIGDYVLSGGELAAMVIIDASVRLLPGVVGSEASLEQESFEAGILEYPQYTRPREWKGHEIPAVLLSGDHGRIARWRREQAEELTRQRRPDLRPGSPPKRRNPT